MPKWRVLVNPAAGSRPIKLRGLRDSLSAADVDCFVEVGESIEEMEALIIGHADGLADGMALVGGDGTFNLAVNTLLTKTELDQPLLGIIPAGTGSDLIRTFGLPQDPIASVRHLVSGNEYTIDIAYVEGQWGKRYFANVAQIGAGAAAAESAPSFPRSLGKARYPLAFAGRLPRFPKANVVIETEKRRYESEALAVIMANAQFFAGGWNVAPRATLIDGVLDIQVINAAKAQAPVLVPKIIRGTHLKDRSVRRFQAARFSVEASEPWPLEADGDFVGNAPLSGEVVPAAVRLAI